MITLSETMNMYRTAGYRETFAMEHGVAEEKGNLIIFHYSPDIGYQDGNCAIYDRNTKTWRG